MGKQAKLRSQRRTSKQPKDVCTVYRDVFAELRYLKALERKIAPHKQILKKSR